MDRETTIASHAGEECRIDELDMKCCVSLKVHFIFILREMYELYLAGGYLNTGKEAGIRRSGLSSRALSFRAFAGLELSIVFEWRYEAEQSVV